MFEKTKLIHYKKNTPFVAVAYSLLFTILIVVLAIAGCAQPQQFTTDVNYRPTWSEERVAELKTYQLCNIWIMWGQEDGYPVGKVYRELLRRIPETEDPQNLYKSCIARDYEAAHE